ncbi:MAG: TAXI family TRAP transporter solute-binding subunit [Magnetococcales bacterium]|nr:TAXI family TRAP transporter solute-binding subunit [Magnetococcales bacterium]
MSHYARPLFPLFLLVILSCSPAPQEKKNQFVSVGTGGVTGVYYPAGGALCRLVNKTRSEHGLRCSVESTGGSIYNTNAILGQELDVGIAQADIAYKAVHGEAPFKEKATQLRSLFALHPESVSLVTRQDAQINSLDDLRGKRINLGNPGSGNARTSEELLQFCDIAITDLALAGRLKAVEMPDALRDNKLDGYFYVVGHPTANIKDIATSTPIRLVPLSGGCADRLIARWDYFVKTEIPAGLYHGVEGAVPTYGVKALLVTSTNLSESDAYQMVKSIFENLDNFKSLHPALNALTPESMLEGLTAPIHPGALKYYKEKGWR